jgi:uncharacterized glyoxalase superfamily protein PhnB
MARSSLAEKPATERANLLRGVIPYFHVEGANEAVKLYEHAFGISRTATEDGKRLMNCQLEINGDLVMVMDAMPDHGFPFQATHSFSLQLIVDDAQAWFKSRSCRWVQAADAGAEDVLGRQMGRSNRPISNSMGVR